MQNGSDTTADVIIHCSDGLLQTHRLVLASISNMLFSALNQDTWDEEISLILMDFTVEEISKYFEELYRNGFKSHMDSPIGRTFGIQDKFRIKNEIFVKEKIAKQDDDFDFHSEEIKLEKIEYPDPDNEEFGDIDGSSSNYEETNLDIQKKKPSNKDREKENSGRNESLSVYLSNETRKYFDADLGNKREFSCKLCNMMISSTKGLMKKHLTENHSDVFQSFKNNYYKGQLPNKKKSALREYYDFNENSSSAICKLCKKEMSNNIGHMHQHFRDKHYEIHKTMKKCNSGGKFGPGKYSQYYSQIPDNPKKVTCLLCNSDFTINNVAKHIKYIHKIYEKGDVPKRYPCSFCGKEFNDKWNKDTHEDSAHRNIFKFSCKQCGKGFTQEDFFIEHMHKQHPSEKLVDIENGARVCTACGKQFVTNHTLKHHKCEGKELPHKCTKCEVAFHHEYLLKNHYKICDMFEQCRDAIRTLTCTSCNIKFDKYSKFIIHCQNSTSCTLLGNKAFSCEECSKLFRTKEQLEKHSRVHTGDTPYLCEFCLKQFKFLHRLNNHQCLQ